MKKFPILCSVTVVLALQGSAHAAIRWSIEETRPVPTRMGSALENPSAQALAEISACRSRTPVGSLELSVVLGWQLVGREQNKGYVACQWIKQDSRYDHYALTFSNNSKAIVWQIDMQSLAHLNVDKIMDRLIEEQSEIETQRAQVAMQYAGFMADLAKSCLAENSEETEALAVLDNDLLDSQSQFCSVLENDSLERGMASFAEDAEACELADEVLKAIQTKCEISVVPVLNRAKQRLSEADFLKLVQDLQWINRESHPEQN